MSNPKAKKRLELIYIIAGKETLVNAECDKLLGELIEPQQRTRAVKFQHRMCLTRCEQRLF